MKQLEEEGRIADGVFKEVSEYKFGLPYVIIRKVRSYDTATLNYNWQVWETQAFSLYTSTTSQIDPNSAGQAVLAVMNFLSGQGIIKYNVPDRIHSKVVYDDEMFLIKTAKSGIFEPMVKAGEEDLYAQRRSQMCGQRCREWDEMETIFYAGLLFVFCAYVEYRWQ